MTDPAAPQRAAARTSGLGHFQTKSDAACTLRREVAVARAFYVPDANAA
jgi:hypothetical protein